MMVRLTVETSKISYIVVYLNCRLNRYETINSVWFWQNIELNAYTDIVDTNLLYYNIHSNLLANYKHIINIVFTGYDFFICVRLHNFRKKREFILNIYPFRSFFFLLHQNLLTILCNFHFRHSALTIKPKSNLLRYVISAERKMRKREAEAEFTFSTGVKYSATPSAVPFTEFITLCIVDDLYATISE